MHPQFAEKLFVNSINLWRAWEFAGCLWFGGMWRDWEETWKNFSHVAFLLPLTCFSPHLSCDYSILQFIYMESLLLGFLSVSRFWIFFLQLLHSFSRSCWLLCDSTTARALQFHSRYLKLQVRDPKGTWTYSKYKREFDDGF